MGTKQQDGLQKAMSAIASVGGTVARLENIALSLRTALVGKRLDSNQKVQAKEMLDKVTADREGGMKLAHMSIVTLRKYFLTEFSWDEKGDLPTDGIGIIRWVAHTEVAAAMMVAGGVRELSEKEMIAGVIRLKSMAAKRNRGSGYARNAKKKSISKKK